MTVNYYIIGELFALLERIELLGQADFADYDSDSIDDVRLIAAKFLSPTIDASTPTNRSQILRSIAFYGKAGTPHAQLLRDRCQELSLADPDSWNRFLHGLALELCGEDYLQRFAGLSCQEVASETDASGIFARVG